MVQLQELRCLHSTHHYQSRIFSYSQQTTTSKITVKNWQNLVFVHIHRNICFVLSLSLFTPIFSPSIRFPSLKLLLIWSALTQFLYQKQFVFRRTPFLRLRYLNSLLYKEFTVFFHKIQKKIIKYL